MLAATTGAVTGALVLTAPAALGAAPQAPDHGPSSPAAVPGRYIVTLASPPVASYAGGVKGLKATRPAGGRKVSVTSIDARRPTTATAPTF